MLKIENLHVSIDEKEVLKGINLHIREGETFILFGPNGSGKTTLLMSLMGFGNYDVTDGKILFRGHDITHMPINERSRLGLGMSFQRPPTIHGLKTKYLVQLCGQGREVDVEGLAKSVNFDTFLDRDINAGFSGGEIKRSELLQLMAQQPHLVLFDEPESGVDLENMQLIGHTIRSLLDGEVTPVPDVSMKELKEQTAAVRVDYHTHRLYSRICERRPRPGALQRPPLLRSQSPGYSGSHWQVRIPGMRPLPGAEPDRLQPHPSLISGERHERT